MFPGLSAYGIFERGKPAYYLTDRRGVLWLKRKPKAKTASLTIPLSKEWDEGSLWENRLSEFDNALRSMIESLQITHSTILRILLRTNRFKINQSLRVLWMAGVVHRDIHGLVISTRATDNDPELKAFIERSFKTHLT